MLSFSSQLDDLKIYFRIPVIVVFKNNSALTNGKLKHYFHLPWLKFFFTATLIFKVLLEKSQNYDDLPFASKWKRI